MRNLFLARTISEIEKHRRIKLCLWAYCYEILNKPLVSDAKFDSEALKVDLNVNTDRPDLDDWFRKNFQTYTGQWIYTHPELIKLGAVASRL